MDNLSEKFASKKNQQKNLNQEALLNEHAH